MQNLKSAFTALVALLSLNAHAQYMGGPGRVTIKQKSDIAITAGDVRNLLNVHHVNIVYDYSNMAVGDFDKEKDYLDKKAAEYEKKEAGKGEKFKQNWVAARGKQYEPKFLALFNDVGGDFGLAGTNYATDNEVTLKIITTYTEPGFNVGIVKKPAYINIECSFVDKNNKELLRYSIKNAQGTTFMGYDFDASLRIAESYAKGAKMMMKDLKKKLKKVKK